ncbi:MAG: VOC family protein [Chitinophagaceae bacterium]
MSEKIFPCLWFDGNAKEAAGFYCSVFQGAKITHESPLVVMVEIFGKKVMGLNGGPMFRINPSISLFVLCADIDSTNKVWEKLSEGGSVLMQIDTYPWSKRYGWVKDKFGMTWQVSVVAKEGDRPAITPSLLFTGSQFGKAAEAINLYTGAFKNGAAETVIYYPETDPHAGKVMYAEIRLEESMLIVMDGPGDHAYTFSEGVSLVVDCDGQEEVDHFWNKFTADGGQESQCGWLKDKFGVSWQIVPKQLMEYLNNPDREKAGHAMQAMLKMKKIVIADLKKAFDSKQ